MRRNKRRHFSVFEASDTDTPLPSGVHLFSRLRIGRVDHVVFVNGQPAGAAEVIVFEDELPCLGQNLNAVVVAIGDD